MIALRPVSLTDDRDAIGAFDRSFTTEYVYRVIGRADAFALEAVFVDPPVTKAMPLAGDLDGGPSWEHGLVAVEGDAVLGFAAYTHQRWNRRTELWHLYVDAPRRGEGIGRMLVTAVVAAAREAGMRCVWLETSSVAYPAIQFYRRLGFALCGLDTSLYDPDGPGGGETALYFAYSLAEAVD
jgi:ribosomal protein S18 acetylase RimI-like enzyme